MAFKLPFKNTPRSGQVRTMIYQEDGIWYGVALEFNIVESGESPGEVMILLNEAMTGYVETAFKKKMSIAVLNQTVDTFFDSLWNSSEETTSSKQKVYNRGLSPITAFA